jgi:hypothetical protein
VLAWVALGSTASRAKASKDNTLTSCETPHLARLDWPCPVLCSFRHRAPDQNHEHEHARDPQSRPSRARCKSGGDCCAIGPSGNTSNHHLNRMALKIDVTKRPATSVSPSRRASDVGTGTTQRIRWRNQQQGSGRHVSSCADSMNPIGIITPAMHGAVFGHSFLDERGTASR